MRTITFRGKILETGEWLFGDLIENQGRFFIYKASSETTFKDDDDGQIVLVAKEVDQKTVSQYTGLKDKNGKAIYEGDIVNVSWGKEKFPMQVLFHEGEWVLNEYGDDTYHSLYDFRQNELEVIGNIHDNPELLKGGQNGTRN